MDLNLNGGATTKVESKEVFDVIIIGAGPGGMTAALYAVRSNLKTLMLEKGAPGGKLLNTHEVENWTGMGKMSGADMAMAMFDHTQELDVEYRYGDVTNITLDNDYKLLETADGTIYRTKSVIVASGTQPRPTNAKGEEELNGKGISWCAICDGAFYKDLDVVVVGGGNAAIEEATYLSKIVNHITVVNILPSLQADAKAVDLAKATGKFDFKLGYEVLSFDGENKVEGVTIKNVETQEVETVNVQGAFVFIGQIPTTEFVKDLGITNQWGYIDANHRMETAVPGVFGVGDVIDKELRQISTAAADGSIAAVNCSKYVEEFNNKHGLK
jgi:thioredoxin reductase (NADPH)